MKKIITILIASLTTLQFVSAQTEQDKKAVNRALLDYIEGFYDGDSSKIIRSISPDVVKYGYYKNKNTGHYEGEPMSYKEMIAYAARVGISRKNGKQLPANAPRKTEVYEVLEQTASAKITAWWGSDYILLEKKGDKWMIRNVLWQGPLNLVEEHDFTLYDGRIYVKIFLNNKPLNFMLDIGADGVGRVDAKISKELGLDSVGVIDNSDGVNVSNVPLVGINKLKFGSIEFKDIKLMSRNYKQANPVIYMDGILGRGFFEEYILVIDYPNSKIRFYKGSLDKSAKGVLQYERPFRVKGKIAGNEYEFNFDSGSNLDFHFPKSIIEKYNFRATGVIITARRANTEFKLHQAVINERFLISSIKRDSINVYYSDLANEINVGGVFLRNYKLTIDQKNKCLTIQ